MFKSLNIVDICTRVPDEPHTHIEFISSYIQCLTCLLSITTPYCSRYIPFANQDTLMAIIA